MDSKKNQRLESIIREVQGKWGAESLHKGTLPHFAPAHLPTSFPAVDKLLRIGGLPRGHITEFVGGPSSGAYLMALRAIASAQSQGEEAVYIDLEHRLNPDYAVSQGVRPAKLLLVRPPSAAEGLDILLDLLRGEGVGIVVWDSVTALRRGRLPSTALHRLIAPLSASSSVLLCLNSDPARVLEYDPAIRLSFANRRWLRRHRDVVGYYVRVTVLKNHFGPAGRHVDLTITL